MEITWTLHQRKLGFQGELYKLAEKANSERSQQRGDQQENQVFQSVAKYTGKIRQPFFLMGKWCVFHPQYPHRYGPIGFIP